MQRTIHILLFTFTCLMLTACGKGDSPDKPGGSAPNNPSSSAKIEDRVKARLTELLGLVKAGKNAEAAAYIVYRGDDEARKWKSVCDYSAADEKRQVDRVCDDLREVIALGKPTFVKFDSEKESEGTWLVWEVKFGEGDSAKSIHMACLEIDGKIALGDVD